MIAISPGHTETLLFTFSLLSIESLPMTRTRDMIEFLESRGGLDPTEARENMDCFELLFLGGTTFWGSVTGELLQEPVGEDISAV